MNFSVGIIIAMGVLVAGVLATISTGQGLP